MRCSQISVDEAGETV